MTERSLDIALVARHSILALAAGGTHAHFGQEPVAELVYRRWRGEEFQLAVQQPAKDKVPCLLLADALDQGNQLFPILEVIDRPNLFAQGVALAELFGKVEGEVSFGEV